VREKENIRNLVIVGSWNNLLFTAKWLNDNIYDGKLEPNIQMEIIISGNSIQQRVFHLPNYKLEISQARLCFILKKIDQEHFDILFEDITKLLTKLQHTPIQKMGINLVFNEDIEKPFENELNFYQLDNMVEANEIITVNKKNCILRLSINRAPNFVEFDFNYSYKVKDVAQLKSFLEVGLYSHLEKESSLVIKKIMEKFNA